MAALFAVLVAISLGAAISIAYVLVLRELRRINTNLEQFIKLVADARQNDTERGTYPANDEAASGDGAP
jgi:hypothetical protein